MQIEVAWLELRVDMTKSNASNLVSRLPLEIRSQILDYLSPRRAYISLLSDVGFHVSPKKARSIPCGRVWGKILSHVKTGSDICKRISRTPGNSGASNLALLGSDLQYMYNGEVTKHTLRLLLILLDAPHRGGKTFRIDRESLKELSIFQKYTILGEDNYGPVAGIHLKESNIMLYFDRPELQEMARLGIHNSNGLQLYGCENLWDAEVSYELEPIDTYESHTFTTDQAVLAVRCIIKAPWWCVFNAVPPPHGGKHNEFIDATVEEYYNNHLVSTK